MVSLLLSIFFTLSAYALAPAPRLKMGESFGKVQHYYDSVNSVVISQMASTFEFKDLTNENVKELNSAMDLKKEYGRMFGFSDWSAVSQKLIDLNGERIFVIEGQYKNQEKTVVNFLEVYWANPQSSGQYLITSETRKLTTLDFKEFLTP